MRITNKMIAQNLLSVIEKNRSLAADLQQDIATTKKLRRPSDDPSGVVQLQQYNVLLSRNEQYQKNITQISGFVTDTMANLDAISDRLQEARDIAIQGASETLNAEARAGLAATVDQLIESVVNLANGKYRDKYLFAGNLTTGNVPFTRSGDVITYNGNDGKLQGKIGFEAKVDYNKSGTEVFAPAGGVDIFSELINLKQGLENNDTDAIHATIDTLKQAVDHVVNQSSEMGGLLNRLDLTSQMIESENINLADKISKIQDTDMVKAIVDSQILETALNTGLKTMSRTIQVSLVDFVS